MSTAPRLRTKYEEEIAPKLKTRFRVLFDHASSKITKICLNQGLGKATADKKIIDAAVDELTLIAGQKGYAYQPCNERISLTSNSVKVLPIGAKVTLRGDRCTSS
jgi:large subunit ribosomal protein L5